MDEIWGSFGDSPDFGVKNESPPDMGVGENERRGVKGLDEVVCPQVRGVIHRLMAVIHNLDMTCLV